MQSFVQPSVDIRPRLPVALRSLRLLPHRILCLLSVLNIAMPVYRRASRCGLPHHRHRRNAARFHRGNSRSIPAPCRPPALPPGHLPQLRHRAAAGRRRARGRGGRPHLPGRPQRLAASRPCCKIAAGLRQPDARQRASSQPGATIRYLPQEPDLSGFPTTLAYVEAGARRRATTATAPAICCEQLGLTGDEDPPPLGRRGPPRRARPGAGPASPTSCCSTSRPTISTCRPSNGWRRN